MHTHTPHTHTPHATHTNTHTLWLSLDICIVCFQAEECMQTNREYKSYLCHNLCQFLISAVHSARHLASLPVLPRCTHITHSSLPRIGTEDTEWFHPVQGRTAQSDVTQYRKREQSGVPQYKNRDQCVVLPNTRTDNTVWCYSVKTDSTEWCYSIPNKPYGFYGR